MCGDVAGGQSLLPGHQHSIEAQNSHQFKMDYYDYGNVSLHSREDFHTLLPALQPHNYPRMCLKAHLHGVQPRRRAKLIYLMSLY